MTGPSAIVLPGSPQRVHQLADQLQEISAGLLRLAAVVRVTAAADWHGVAAAAFRQLLTLDADPLAKAGAVLAQADEHLRAHASVLCSAQADAEHAVLLDRRAAWATEQWRADARTAVDPGHALRRRAADLLAEARRRVATSGAAAAAALHAAARLAPTDPGRVSRDVARAWASSRELSVGAVESSWGLLTLAARFSTARAMGDPLGYLHDARADARSAVASLHEPKALARSALDVDTFEDSPARWLGHLLPGAALGVASGGTSVATRSSSLAVRALSRAPGERGTALRAAVTGRGGYGRSGLRARDLAATAGPPSPLGTSVRLPGEASAVGAAAARDARWAEARLTPSVERAIERAGGARVGQQHALKGVGSLRRKLADELGTGVRTTPAAARLNDTVRYTVVHPDERYVHGALRTVEQLRAAGFELAQAKSTWGGQRYQGLNLVWHDPGTGRLFEVQVHTPGSWEATVRTHAAYELYRDAGVDATTKAHLEAEIGAQYAAVPRPHGIDVLSARLRALGLDAPPHATAPQLAGVDPRRLADHAAASLLVPLGPGHPDLADRPAAATTPSGGESIAPGGAVLRPLP